MKFEPIVEFILDIEPSDSSIYKTYLYEIYCSVSVGKVSKSLANKHPCNTIHAI